jgi:hypothetical protein
MTENMQADSVQSRQAGFVRCCHRYYTTFSPQGQEKLPLLNRDAEDAPTVFCQIG